MKKILLIALMMLGCETAPSVQDLRYVKDPRTNLCFASYHMGTTYGFMTIVPCTDQVEAAIRQDTVKLQ